MKYILLLACFTAFSLANAQTKLSLDYQWSFSSYGAEDLGLTGLVVEDLDNNGRPEIIASSNLDRVNFRTWGLLSVLEFNPSTNTYEKKWTSRVYFAEITEVQVFDPEGDGIPDIFLGFDTGEIKVINGRTFQERHSFFTNRTEPAFPSLDRPCVNSIAFGDIDNDGITDIVATNADTTYVYSTTFALKKKIQFPGGAITLGNVDNDPAIEAIYAKGYVVEYSADGRKDEVKFFPNPFGKSIVRLADMNKDGVRDVLYSSADTVHVIDVTIKQRIRSIPKKESSGEVADFQLYDYTMDGVPDVFIGNSSFDVLFVYDGATTLYDYDIQDPHRFGLESLVIANLDNDPDLELLWTAGGQCTCSDHFFVYNMTTRQREWISNHWQADFQSFDVGNIDDNPDKEFVIGSFGFDASFDDHGFLSTLDLDTKITKEVNDDPPISAFADALTLVRIRDVDNDGKNEILVGIDTYNFNTEVAVLDNEFNLIRTLDIDGMSYVADAEVADVDGDQENEIIITSGTWVTAGSVEQWQNYIYIFDGKTGALEWKSEQLAGRNSRLGNIRIGNVDDDPAKEIVVLRFKMDGWLLDTSALFVIDGSDYSVTFDESLEYTSFDLTDIDNDGIEDIIAGTSSGKVLAIDGASFAIKSELVTAQGKILSLHAADVTGDMAIDYIFSNEYKLFIFDAEKNQIVAETDTLSHETGRFNALQVIGSAEDAEILLNTTHTLYSFKLNVVDIVTSADETLPRLKVKAYPNPFNSTLVIHNDSPFSIDKITIVDINGIERIARDVHIPPAGEFLLENTASLPQGLYLCSLYSRGSPRHTVKLVKR
jgi:hypothetical protein